MKSEMKTPCRLRGKGAKGDALCGHSSGFDVAITGESYAVALLDRVMQVTRLLSGRCSSLAEAKRRLLWLRRRYPSAQIVADLSLRKVYR